MLHVSIEDTCLLEYFTGSLFTTRHPTGTSKLKIFSVRNLVGSFFCSLSRVVILITVAAI